MISACRPNARSARAGSSALYLVGGASRILVGALTLSSVNAPIVGSSGAVSTVVGAYLALFPRSRLWVRGVLSACSSSSSRYQHRC